MKKLVIIPGGFHPFHAGHAALYNSAREAFPGADVYVAATDDTSTRPFPFAVKEKLAQLAGVPAGRFVKVKSPFSADEITSRYPADDTVVIFVRSEKDRSAKPQPGGVKKDGSPAKLQPLNDHPQPLSKHTYMAYLPTVEFGPGITSASEIRAAWPGLDEKRKTAMVMSLYPKTQGNAKLAATVVKMLDTAIGSMEESHTVGYIQEKEEKRTHVEPEVDKDPELRQAKMFAKQHYNKFTADPDEAFDKWVQRGLKHSEQNDAKHDKLINFLTDKIVRLEREIKQIQQEQPVLEDYLDEKWSQKYKRSIDCSHPRGFSQRAHCAGRKK